MTALQSNPAFADAVARLVRAGVPTPVTDCWRLIEYVRQRSFQKGCHSSIIDEIDETGLHLFETLVRQREKRQPVSKIIGKRWFFNHEFEINSDVLDPRPESELLVTAALAHQPKTVLDLGTGSGCLLLSILAQCPQAKGLGIDCSKKALKIARQNAQKLACQTRARLEIGDWLNGLSSKFDIIVTNPPYVSADEYRALAPEITDWEPKQALTPSADGLQAFRDIAKDVAAHLNPDGRLIVEIGFNQLASVSAIFAESGLELEKTHLDLDQRPRALEFQVALNLVDQTQSELAATND